MLGMLGCVIDASHQPALLRMQGGSNASASQQPGVMIASPTLAHSRGRKRSFSELQAGSIDGPRPQDTFPDPPDNSNRPFQPIIHAFLEGKQGRWDNSGASLIDGTLQLWDLT